MIAINVGNTRTQIARVDSGDIAETRSLPNSDTAGIISQIVEWWSPVKDADGACIVVASVNDQVAGQIRTAIHGQVGVEPYRIGDDLPVPIGRQLDPETITGVDRLLNAAAAYDNVKQACVVVDAGTAITVDFVDGEGTFHGGAIGPGAQMQLHALHEHTSALPEIEFTRPEPEAFGKSTSQAMLHGVFSGLRGLVWRLVEQYSERYGAYPMIIATGGDAQMLFGDDELVDRIVPNLTIMGIQLAARTALSADASRED